MSIDHFEPDDIDVAFKSLCRNKGWEVLNGGDILVTGHTPWAGIHFTCALHKRSGDILSFFCDLGYTVSPKTVPKFLALLNLINLELPAGNFCHDILDNSIHFSYSWLVPEEVGSDYLTKFTLDVFKGMIETCKDYYPSLELVAAGVAPEEALKIVLEVFDDKIAGSA